ncbi:Rha family transcriptional regulator [uncultured Amphritea sp.]|uniref:Rha family transcriptional regulator n=1 Tax=uncultured Amphritea sp. TaxID=981605 RepID=UPI0026123ABC|nr:Rha family transcriptional regulator [uncultured Amphritea sp.]
MNHALTTCNYQMVMSSREISDLVEKRHDNVKRTIEMLTARGVIQLPQSEDVKNERGQTVSEYRITKRDSYVIVAQLSPEFTARLVDRWQELETRSALPDFTNPVEAARAWADQAEQKQQLALENDSLKHENDHLSRFFSDGVGIVDFARTLNGVNIQQVQKFLAAKGWIRRAGFEGYKANSQYRDRYVADSCRNWTHPVTHEQCQSFKPVLLKQGAKRLYQFYLNGELPMKSNWDGCFLHQEAMV